MRTIQLDVPLIRQSRHGCVDAVIAMLGRARGIVPTQPCLPEGASGVSESRLDEHLLGLGLRPIDIAPTVEAVCGELREGRPLLMTISRWIGSHMGLIVGSDDEAEVLTWLDPDHDQPRRLRYQDLPGRAAEPGSALVTALSPGDPEPPDQRVDALRLRERRVGRALREGDVDGARALADEARTSLGRARLAWRFPELFAATSPDQRAEALLACPEAGPILHSRALLGLVSRHGRPALRRHRERLHQLPPRVRTLAYVQRAAADGELKLALHRLEVAIAREPEVEALHELRAEWRDRLGAFESCAAADDD